MLPILKYEELHPFVRCVGKSRRLNQAFFHVAYDYRMLAICEGCGFIEHGEKKYTTNKGELYIISPGTRYRVVSEGYQKIIVFNFDMTHSHCDINDPVISVPEEKFAENEIIEAFDLSLFFGENGCIKREISWECIDICEKILATYEGSRMPFDDIIISSLFAQVIYHAILQTNSRCKNDLASSIFSFINENYKNDLSLENTAEHFHIHPTYVNRLLNKHYGTSFRQLLLKVRFEKAVYLIDNTDMSVKEIAEKVGFNDAQYFSYAFYKRFGHYPTVYRK